MIAESSPGFQKRFIHFMDLFLKAVTIQARDRTADTIPNIEDYVTVRRDTSGLKAAWALIEYANGLDLPDEVMEHPIIQSLEVAANDFVSWSNVRIYCGLFTFLQFSFSMISRTSSRTIVNRPKATHTT